MSHLDRHVATVQNKMALGTMLGAISWTLLGFAAMVWLAILIDHLFQVHLPRQMIWFWSGIGAATVLAVAYALRHRPTPHEAAVAIDVKLSLKEKFSTALYIRKSRDPFAVAAVRDAEQTAENVSLHKRFPLAFPRVAAWTIAVAIAAALSMLLPMFDLIGREQARQHRAQVAQTKRDEAERTVRSAIAQLEAAPKAVAEQESIKLARQDLARMLQRPITDPAHAQRKADDALKQMEAVKDQIKNQQRYAEAQNEIKAYKAMSPAPDETGPVADAHRSLAKGDFTEAVDALNKAVKNFDQMDQKEKDKAAQQMQNLAQQIQQKAEDPKVQQNIQQQLQQMGANQQMAQQMQNLMQQAAQGNQQAQQQLQQMANQLAQQANQQQGGNQQQQQQAAQAVQQAIQKMQQQANGQAQAQQMAQAAQQLAQAMKNAAQQGQQSQPGQQGQQAGAQQGKGQQGQQGQGQQGQQQMAQAGQQMQQQMQQLQAMANDGQAVAAGQQGGQPGNQGQNGDNGQWGNQNNPQQQANQQPGQNAQGGQGGFANGAIGQRPAAQAAPFGTKQELSASENNDKGKILASSFVKDNNPLKGSSQLSLREVAENAQKDATDEVDEDRIPRSAQNAVKGYFETLKREAK